MEVFRVHILGCGSALPTLHHFPSAQIVEIRGKYFLVDCGEGTQMQLRKASVKFTKISGVFISHLHGDHCFGLIGLISTFGLLGRTSPLHIYAPRELEAVLQEQMKLFVRDPGYEVQFHAFKTNYPATIYEDRSLEIATIPLEHRMPCCGFLFKEKPLLPHIRRDMIDMYGIPTSQIGNIKAGMDYALDDGTIVNNEKLVSPALPPRSYAYCSDTRYLPTLPALIASVSTLYHESTYAEDQVLMAEKYYHSTAKQAATIAKEANAGKLLLGHYSSRYDDENLLLEEAKAVFPNSFLTKEMMVFDV